MKRVLCLGVLLCIALTSPAIAQVPRTISFQGVLTDAQGNLVPDGNHSLTLNLYDNVSSATPIYTEAQSVPVVRGVFNVIIGSVTPLPGSIEFDRAYFLGVKIDGGLELTPRTALTAVPYALRAERANVAESVAATATGVVRTVNGQSGAVTLVGAGSTTVTNSGNQITISSSGGGGTGIAGVQNTDNTLNITNPNGPVATINVRDQGITTAQLAANAVTSEKIEYLGVHSDDLADGSVTQAKLAAGVTLPPSGSAGGDLSGNYPDPHIADNAVTTAKLNDNSVTSSKLTDNAVTSAKIADDAVTAAKISPFIVSSINGVYNDAGNIDLIAGANVTIVPDNTAKTVTISSAGGGGGLTLPFIGSLSGSGAGFSVTNSGDGKAGHFRVDNPSSTADALMAYNNSTSAASTAFRAAAVGGRAVEAFNNSATTSAVYAYNSGDGPVAIFGNSGTSTGNIVEINKSGGSGRGLNMSYTGTGSAIYVANNSTGVGAEIKQDGTGNAAYFHIDNTTSSSNTLRATTASTNVNSDALEVDAVAGNALDAGNNSGTTPTIYASNINASTTSPVIITNGGFRTDVSGTTTSARYVASSNLGSGVPAAGGIYKDNVICAWARVNTSGTALSSFGCTVSRTGTGQYRVTYNNAFASSADGVPVVTAHYSSGPRFAMIAIVNAGYCDIEIYNSSGTLSDSFFHVIVIGRQ